MLIGVELSRHRRVDFCRLWVVRGGNVLRRGRGVVQQLCRRTLLGCFGVYILLSVRGWYRLSSRVEWLYRLRCWHVPSDNRRVELRELRCGDAVGVWSYLLLELSRGPVPTKYRRAQLHSVRRRIGFSFPRCYHIDDLRELRCRHVCECRIKRVLKLCCWLVLGERRFERVYDVLGGHVSSWDRRIGLHELRGGAVLDRRGCFRCVNVL